MSDLFSESCPGSFVRIGSIVFSDYFLRPSVCLSREQKKKQTDQSAQTAARPLRSKPNSVRHVVASVTRLDTRIQGREAHRKKQRRRRRGRKKESVCLDAYIKMGGARSLWWFVLEPTKMPRLRDHVIINAQSCGAHTMGLVASQQQQRATSSRRSNKEQAVTRWHGSR